MNKQMPANEYHQNTEFISASALKELRKSPAHFYQSWKGHVEQTPAMIRGEFLHSVVLEQDLSKFAKRPVTEDGSLVRSNSKEYKSWLETIGSKTTVSPDLYDDAENYLNAFCNSEIAMKLYKNAKIELSIFNEAKNGLKIKGRPDILGLNYIADYKTTDNIEFFERDIFNRGLHYQLAQYVYLAEKEFGCKIEHFDFIAQETKAPFGIKIFRFDRSNINECLELWSELINQVKICIDENSFPGYDEVPKLVRIPTYVLITKSIFEGVG